MNETLYRWTFKFHKVVVVRQHNSGVVEDFILPHFVVYFRIQNWKNYWNRSTLFAKVIVIIKVARFYGPWCIHHKERTCWIDNGQNFKISIKRIIYYIKYCSQLCIFTSLYFIFFYFKASLSDVRLGVFQSTHCSPIVHLYCFLLCSEYLLNFVINRTTSKMGTLHIGPTPKSGMSNVIIVWCTFCRQRQDHSVSELWPLWRNRHRMQSGRKFSTIYQT